MRPRVMGQGKRPGARGRPWLQRAAVPLPLPAFAADTLVGNQAFEGGHIIVLSGLACGGVALAIAAGLWALAEQRSARRLRRTLRQAGTRTKAALGERD